MKSSKLSTILSATVLSAGLAFAPSILPASAQSNPGTDTNQGNETQQVYETREGTRSVEEDNDNGDWGLLGLLGLLGLAGLAGRNRHESPTYYADPARDREEVSGRSSTTYR
ncbi:WGxxGxxG family protein [Laspinema olomoucense]|uniref:WGxxGxxG family protein n=1 Tax=Laspinema olomoucense TaxID=3231600 RepID=UPI0021BAD199|nr:WGxxGxxG family protein [Laspinema sp. D3d]MCT7971956.1 WGxxGxxG-CTERM domain-containing protein [Laspinema sp. D3d]